MSLALTLPLRGSRLIEASAGTGKTFTISALVVRLVLGHGGELAGFGRALQVPQILVVTFTDAATQELRDRIRLRLTQAARCFRDEAEQPDDLIDALREEIAPEDWAACAARLELAAQWMDEAAISTIHGWCYRMLREHAFDSGSLFTQTLETDDRELRAEVVRDYWREYCYPLLGAELAWVQSHWGTPDGLMSRLSGLLAHARPQMPEATLQALLAEQIQARHSELEGLKAPWARWVPELRALCDAACEAKLVDGRKLQARHYNAWFDKLLAWAQDPSVHDPELSGSAYERLSPQGMAEAFKKGEPISHEALAELAGLPDRLAALPSPDAAVLAHAASWVRQRLDEEKRRRAEMGFDDMLEHLDRALHGENGEQLAERIRNQFPVALVDEFQDTDPVQYRIFDRIYRVAESREDCAFLMIGDPKQAIYAFRGADIHTYLQARRATQGRHYSLDTNYRSSAGMVEAVNRVFMAAEERAEGQGAFLFRRGEDNPLPFVPVRARDRAERFVVEASAAAPLTFWLAGQDEPMSAELYRKTMARSCATAIVKLLGQGQIGAAGFAQADGRMMGVQPADIAVLVRGFGEAQAIRGALAERGVRSVYLSDRDSVFDRPEAGDVLRWLEACAMPDDDRKLRAALATAVLDLPLDALDQLNRDERVWEDWVLKFRGYRDAWRRQGVLPMLRRFMDDFHLPLQLAQRQDGERVLTNLLHLAELLQQAASELDGEQALIRYLTERPGAAAGDAQVLRLESDEQLLKVVTVHKSKGLEYPLVFLPFASSFRAADKTRPPLRYHDDRGRLVVCATPTDEDAERADDERLAEDLRLLYVALTRARHACWLGLADIRRGNRRASCWHRSALGYLLGAAQELESPQQLRDLCEVLVADVLQVEPLPEADSRVWHDPSQGAIGEPHWRVPTRRAGEAWGIASYSALRVASASLEDDAAPDLHADSSPETPSEQKLYDDDTGADAAQGILAGASGMHRFPRGPGPGTFLHGLFEWAGEEGFSEVAGDLDRITDAVARRCNLRGLDAWITPLSRWLAAMLDEPLPLEPVAAGARARKTSAQPLRLSALRAYQVEMEFWFESRRVDVRRLDALVCRHVLAGAARPPLEADMLNGMFKGFMDLAFEHDGRYYVADYKSNWLGASDAAYTPQAMRAEMLAKRYDLQYVLYLLALHRQLALRMPDYDYDVHMGGAVYLFLRGTNAPSKGVYVDRPPRALIEALDALFAGRLPREAA